MQILRHGIYNLRRAIKAAIEKTSGVADVSVASVSKPQITIKGKLL